MREREREGGTEIKSKCNKQIQASRARSRQRNKVEKKKEKKEKICRKGIRKKIEVDHLVLLRLRLYQLYTVMTYTLLYPNRVL